MDNLINVYMNYKVNHLTKCGILIYGRDSKFIRRVFSGYIRTYIDNYYYETFNTIDDNKFTLDNLYRELSGIRTDMKMEYKDREIVDSNIDFYDNNKTIDELRDISYDLVQIDMIKYDNKEEISEKVKNYLNGTRWIKPLLNSEIINKIISYTIEDYYNGQRLFDNTESYFELIVKRFRNNKKYKYFEIIPKIDSLKNYRRTLVNKVYKSEEFDEKKFYSIMQKISLLILDSIINKKSIDMMFVEIKDSFVWRGQLINRVLQLMDNPLIRKYVVFGISYNNYKNHEDAFYEDYNFACIQDFSHINDIYAKTEAIYKEGFFNYLIVKDFRYVDLDYFITYDVEGMEVLVFEEE